MSEAMRLKVMLVVGARPNFMKIAPIYTELERHPNLFEIVLVHTGQHYDANMSKVFFEELQLPQPDVYLGVGSGSHAEQTAEIIKRFEPVLTKHKPHLLLVVGDVNSTIACALTAVKSDVSSEHLQQVWQHYNTFIEQRKVDSKSELQHDNRSPAFSAPVIAHVEAGERSFDMSMPEEVNRVTTDVLSDLLLTTSEDSERNLLAEGIDARRIFTVGNIMIDALLNFLPRAENSDILNRLNATLPSHFATFKNEEFALVTLHRPGNVDHAVTLMEILSGLISVSEQLPMIFPMHPRTRKLIHSLPDSFATQVENSRILVTEPLGYLDFLHLQSKARMVLTDSGGVQVETSYLGIPCLTLRPRTEWEITLRSGTNRLVPPRKDEIIKAAKQVITEKKLSPARIPNWDGKTSERIVNLLRDMFQPGKRS